MLKLKPEGEIEVHVGVGRGGGRRKHSMNVGKERKLGSRAGPAWALFLGPIQGLMAEAGGGGGQ